MAYDLNNLDLNRNHIIDLRSDTVTKPTPSMRKVMAEAEVGDDVYGEDPTVNRLERMIAERLGKDSGIFMTSGTQSNVSAVLAHCARGEEVLVGDKYHIFNDEAAGVSVLGGVPMTPINLEEDNALSPEKIFSAIKPDDPHCPISKLVCMENTVSGHAIELKKMESVKSTADKYDLSTHLDGARFFNAITELKCTETELANCADTVSVCLSKGLGTPAGSVLVLPKELESKARRIRKMLGGSMRQAGILAAAGIYALEHNVGRIKEDHRKAEFLAKAFKKFTGEKSEDAKVIHSTNMVFFTPRIEHKETLFNFLQNKGIVISSPNPSTRIVIHLDVSEKDLTYIIKSFEDFHDAQ